LYTVDNEQAVIVLASSLVLAVGCTGLGVWDFEESVLLSYAPWGLRAGKPRFGFPFKSLPTAQANIKDLNCLGADGSFILVERCGLDYSRM
jgi:hypothetical protein